MKIIFNQILHIFGYILKPNKKIKQFLKNMCQDLTTRKLYIYTTNLRGNKKSQLVEIFPKIVDVQLQMCVNLTLKNKYFFLSNCCLFLRRLMDCNHKEKKNQANVQCVIDL